MSHLAEVYSLGCGVPLDRPSIADSFFPLPFPIDKVILIHAFAGSIVEQNGQRIAARAAKLYDYYGEIVDLLKPILGPLGYCFVQIGSAGEPILNGVHGVCGQTSLSQCAYLVKNAALLIGNDSMWAHVRGAYDGALVALYGTTSKPHFPYWKNPTKTVLLESHRAGKKPAYADQESPKTINWITPESVAIAALKLLGDETPITRNSLYIGPNYNEHIIEIVPNGVLSPQATPPLPPVVRMDYHFSEENLAANLQHRKCTIITDREIDLTLLVKLKPNIVGMRVEIDKINPTWIKAFMRLGIPAGMFVLKSDEEKVRAMRLDLLETCRFDVFVHPTRADLARFVGIYRNEPLADTFDWSKVQFKTHKFLLSDSKLYLSKAHWQAGQAMPAAEENSGTVIDVPEFWSEQAHSYFYIQ